jgi:uncharacterized membrane protein
VTQSPAFTADILTICYSALVYRWWRNGDLERYRSGAKTDRGTTAVLVGCYAIALLAVNGYAPMVQAFGAAAQWGGIATCVAGLILRCRYSMRGVRLGRYLADFIFWSGVTIASGNLIATITVTVSMLAAYAVRWSAEGASTADHLP